LDTNRIFGHYAVQLLPLTMIQPAFQTLLVSTIGFAALLSSCFLAAMLTTIALPTITRSADVKRCPASADPLAENDCGGHTVAFELDNGRPFMSAWKRYILVWPSPLPQLDPAVRATGVSLMGNVLPYLILSSTPPPCADDDVK
jgi:hypothetical protein